MSTQTPNLNLDLREASDIFNPLSTNSNFETLDSVITEIRKKGGVPTYTTTASANLLKLSENPVPNETLFKFVAAGDANTWSFQETVNNIVTLDGKQKTVKGGEMYVAWVNAANAMVVVAWPDVVDAQTFDGKGPAEWASKAQLDAVNQTAVNATTIAQAAATVANNANKRGLLRKQIYSASLPLPTSIEPQTITIGKITETPLFVVITCSKGASQIFIVGSGSGGGTSLQSDTNGAISGTRRLYLNNAGVDGYILQVGKGVRLDGTTDNELCIPIYVDIFYMGTSEE